MMDRGRKIILMGERESSMSEGIRSLSTRIIELHHVTFQM